MKGQTPMMFEEAERRIIARMTQDERAVHERGCQIVDFYMDIATNSALPVTTRDHARNKLRDFACRQPHQTVADIDGRANT